MALVFMAFLSLATPLLAKCTTHSLEIRGRVEGSIKPDDKVLVTLIFVDHQPEAFGEETAIDIHDGAFEGRVTFNTYSSSFLGGDRCHRRPKGVLVRLIEADGAEQDRTSLNIASDFSYNEGQGEYTPKSDEVLHGWSQPQCEGASLSSPANWHKVDAGPFSILAPSGWEFHHLEGVDSFVGEFLGDGVTLRFDYGRHSSPLKDEKKPAYVATQKSIGGRRAKIVSPRTPGHGVTGVYVRKAGNASALTLFGQDLTSTQQDLALKILKHYNSEARLPNMFFLHRRPRMSSDDVIE